MKLIMVNNRFLLAMMIAKRAKQLKHGEKPLVKTKSIRPLSIALEEVKEGKVFVKKEKTIENFENEEIFDEIKLDE